MLRCTITSRRLLSLAWNLHADRNSPDHSVMTAPLRIVVIIPDPSVDGDEALTPGEAERSRQLRIGLLEAGYNLAATLPADVFLTERLAQIQPDMVVVDAESGARDALEHVVMATRDARRPIVLFTNDQDTSNVGAAIEAGVTAYIVAGLGAERVKPVLDVAMARFRHEERLRQELADAKGALSERKLVDRAKGLLMQRHGISEDAAYARLRKTAMDKNLKMADVAQRLIDAAELLG